MTEIEKLRARVAEVPTDPETKNLMHLMLQKIQGQAEAYQNLEAAKAKIAERHDRYRKERNEARFKAQALESILVEVLAQGQGVPMEDDQFRRYAVARLKPLADALGHTYLGEERYWGEDD